MADQSSPVDCGNPYAVLMTGKEPSELGHLYPFRRGQHRMDFLPRLPDPPWQVQVAPLLNKPGAVEPGNQVLATGGLVENDLVHLLQLPRLVQIEHAAGGTPVQAQRQDDLPSAGTSQVRQVDNHDRPPSRPRQVLRQHGSRASLRAESAFEQAQHLGVHTAPIPRGGSLDPGVQLIRKTQRKMHHTCDFMARNPATPAGERATVQLPRRVAAASGPRPDMVGYARLC